MENFLEEHAEVYLLFARLFQGPPSEWFLSQIVKKRLLTQAEKLGNPGMARRTCWDLAEDPHWPAQAEVIAKEYAALFPRHRRRLSHSITGELRFIGRCHARNELGLAQQFYREHLGRWVFRFLMGLREQPVSKFYRAVGDSLSIFLRNELLTDMAPAQEEEAGHVYA